MKRLRLLTGVFVAIALGIAVAPAKAGLFPPPNPYGTPPSVLPGPLSKIKHLIFIVQENRSFDNFFGTYPGADGIPASVPCQVDPWYPSACDTPYPNHEASNQGGPYDNPYQVQDIDGGKMDGFVESREDELGSGCAPPKNGRRVDPNKIVGYTVDEGIRTSKKCLVDVMGYHDGKDLPNYWAYAQNFTLFDHMYESAESWSLPAHLAIFSGWSAKCTQVNPPDITRARAPSTADLESGRRTRCRFSGPTSPICSTSTTSRGLPTSTAAWATRSESESPACRAFGPSSADRDGQRRRSADQRHRHPDARSTTPMRPTERCPKSPGCCPTTRTAIIRKPRSRRGRST